MDENGLVRLAADGDQQAFEVLVRRHTDAVWRLARTMSPDDYAAEEAVQDTFVNAFRGLRSFRGDSSARTWLLAICHRLCIDRLRIKRAAVVSLDRIREERVHEETSELRLALEQAVETLPPDERRAFVLVDVLGHSREEAARIAGVPSSTMRSRVSRARERLAEILSEAPMAENGV